METLKYPGTITNCKIVMCFKVNLLITSYVCENWLHINKLKRSVKRNNGRTNSTHLV